MVIKIISIHNATINYSKCKSSNRDLSTLAVVLDRFVRQVSNSQGMIPPRTSLFLRIVVGCRALRILLRVLRPYRLLLLLLWCHHR